MTFDYNKADALARQAIDLAKASILSDNHFLSAAVGRLDAAPIVADDGGVSADIFSLDPFAVRGVRLCYDARALLRHYRATQEAPKHDLLHAVMHCVFLHPYVGAAINQELWDAACDMAAERAVMECCGIRPGERGLSIQAILHRVELDLGCRPTAEKIYHRLCEGKWAADLSRWAQLFHADNHAGWYAFEAEEPGLREKDAHAGENAGGTGSQGEGVSGEGQGQASSMGEASSDASAPPNVFDAVAENEVAAAEEPHRNPQRSQGSARGDATTAYSVEQQGRHLHQVSGFELRKHHNTLQKQQDEWRAVAASLAVNLQTFARKKGQDLTGLVEDLNQAAHQRVDYSAFLRQFATPGEVMQLSLDEFDYIFYTYGLQLYGNVPLIEPLEYREEKRIREFVLVIDTSGSVQGDTVRSFVTSTFDILKSTENFHKKIQVHVIQADAQVRRDDVITSAEELEQWAAHTAIQGGGGTDFRPAFAYVDALVEEGAFTDLGGLVYFTDGWGTYPAKMPDYRTAFVFYDEDYRPDIVPSWAAQVVLDGDAIDAMETERKKR